MQYDKQLVFSLAQAVTVTAPSTNVVDLGPINVPIGHAGAFPRDLGLGVKHDLVVQVETDFTAAGAATLTVTVEVDDNAAFTSPKVVATSLAIPVASLTKGKILDFPYDVPEGSDEQYIRLNYTVATGPMTAGKLNAFFVKARPTNKF